jgi:WD40 repeat protein
VNPTNRLVIAANSKAYFLHAQSVRIERRITTPEGIYSAALSPDGHQCATWSLGSSVVEVWDADDGRRLTALAAPNGSGLCFSPEGRWLVTADGEEYVFWERTSWMRRHSIPRGMTVSHGKLDFSPDGRMVALSVGRGNVALFDASTFTPLATFEAPEEDAVSGIAFSPDGAQLAISTPGPGNSPVESGSHSPTTGWDETRLSCTASADNDRREETDQDFCGCPAGSRPIKASHPISLNFAIMAE